MLEHWLLNVLDIGLPLKLTHVGINFNDRVLVTNPTSFYLGRGILAVGIIAIAIGAITQYMGDFVLPAPVWIAIAVPTIFIGWTVMRSGLRKN